MINIPEKEVYFPDAVTFPFAEAQQEALDKLKDVADLPDAPACDLPLSEEALEPAAVLPEPPSAAPRVKVTFQRT